MLFNLQPTFTVFEYVVYFHLVLPIMTMVLAAFTDDVVTPVVRYMQRIEATIDSLSKNFGHLVSWLTILMVLVMFSLVIMRYVFGVSFIWMQESITYMHGLLFMLAASYTFYVGGHVRVDLIYREATPKTKAIVDLLGAYFFLFPVLYLIFDTALPYVSSAWAVKEGSKETSGLQAVYLLKGVILVFAWMMILQGLSSVIRAASLLMGYVPLETTEQHGETIV